MFRSRKNGEHDDEPNHKSGRDKLDEGISIHIFSTSATLIGVCLTVIGILEALLHLKGYNTLADELLAVSGLLFLVSCVLSYYALRTKSTSPHRRIEKISDVIFLLALALMAITCGLIAYAIY